VRREFLIERQGKSFCLYAGLLDEAHQRGLKSIHTELIQAPTDGNNRVAICNATVVFEQDGVERTYTGIGDAAPNNVAPAMQTCLLRMAETRAKARALRDAVNIGVAAFEELGEEESANHAPRAEPRRRTEQSPASTRSPRNPEAPAGPATQTQMGALKALCDKQKRDLPKVIEQECHVTPEDLSAAQAADLIRKLNTPPQRSAA